MLDFAIKKQQQNMKFWYNRSPKQFLKKNKFYYPLTPKPINEHKILTLPSYFHKNHRSGTHTYRLPEKPSFWYTHLQISRKSVVLVHTLTHFFRNYFFWKFRKNMFGKKIQHTKWPQKLHRILHWFLFAHFRPKIGPQFFLTP